jgi:hypothetical protein
MSETSLNLTSDTSDAFFHQQASTNMDALDFYTFAAIVVTLAIAWYVWRL